MSQDQNEIGSGSVYRREIDGLRSIAVVSVVFYHFSVTGFDGGFVGVDVFFVISGYLIGGILWRELKATGTLSLSRFYVRRLRRLAPAYFSMAIISCGIAYAILLPFEFREFGKELIASTVYLSNIHFFREFGYFDFDAESKVLLHTWSLAVEEQFYIFLPLLFFLFRRVYVTLPSLLLSIAALSLVFSIFFTYVSHSATFYLFPFRAWELLVGVLLAVYEVRKRKPWQSGPILSWIGLILLSGAVVLVEEGPKFPGTQVIVPVLAAALLILNGRDNNVVNRALSARAPVFIGLISYSLYLWHWPVLTLSRYYRDGYDGALETISWLALTFLLAYLSWRFVETPLRRSGALSPKALVSGTAFGSVCLLATGFAVFVQDGMPDRFPPYVRTHIAASADFLQDFSRCTVRDSGPFKGLEVCDLGPEGQEPEYLVWGDSHLRALADGIALAAQEHKRAGLLIWKAGCPPLFDIGKQENTTTRQEDSECTLANARMQLAISQIPGIKRLLLVGRWSYYAEGRGIGLDADNKILLFALPQSQIRAENQSTLFGQAVQGTVAELSKYFDDIMVFRQPPEIPGYDSRVISRLLAHGLIEPGTELLNVLRIPLEALTARTQSAETPFEQLASDEAITVLDSWTGFCDKVFCSVMKNNRSFYFDNNHITNTAARNLRDLFSPLLSPGSDDKQSAILQ